MSETSPLQEEKLIRPIIYMAMASLILLSLSPTALAQGGDLASPEPAWWAVALSWLVPIGFGLLACGTVPPGRTAAVIRIGWLALAVGVIGYWLCGFAFQFGALGFSARRTVFADLSHGWAWLPPGAKWAAGRWGVIGLSGYMLRGPAATTASRLLFLAQLPWVVTAVALPLWSLQGRSSGPVLLLGGVMGVLYYALIGNWTWGGGWLAALGVNLGLGNGFVDLGGAGAVHLAGSACALAGMLAFGVRPWVRTYDGQLALPGVDVDDIRLVPRTRVAEDGETFVPMPPLHLPLLGTLGAWLAAIGWLGWMTNAPAMIALGYRVDVAELMVASSLAVAAGAFIALSFSWLVTGQGNALMTARGALGATIAIGAGAPFVPAWAALVVGAVAGLLVPLAQYTVEYLLRLDDPTSVVATHGLPALWGLLAVGLLADGHAGHGWNQVDGGVIGYLATGVETSDRFAQLRAQGIGVAAVALSCFLISWLLFATIQWLRNAWQGDYTIRLPRRPFPRRRRLPFRWRWWPRVRLAWTAEAPSSGKSARRPWWRRVSSWIGDRVRAFKDR